MSMKKETYFWKKKSLVKIQAKLGKLLAWYVALNFVRFLNFFDFSAFHFPNEYENVWSHMNFSSLKSIYRLWSTPVWMGQLRHKRPPLTFLKWSQISNFLTGVSSLVFKWPENVKNIFIELFLASEWSKSFSEMDLFTENP